VELTMPEDTGALSPHSLVDDMATMREERCETGVRAGRRMQTQREAQLVQALEDKDLMMRELVHRNANNYQIILSLISLFSKMHANDLEEFTDFISQKVIQLSSIQSHLHEQAGAPKCLASVLGKIISAYDEVGSNIIIDIHEPILLSHGQAQLAGMILNEVICNSIEHAFADDERGVIEVGAHDEVDHLHIWVSDDGCGFDGQARRRGSLGLELVARLTSRLDGTNSFTLRDGGGTLFKLRFPLS
jgi:two-component sensor histidine kinase